METVAAEDYGIPDSPHVEIMFEAANDSLTQSLSGNENFTLTQAQIYARSVIGAEIMDYSNRAGNEDFIGTIGSGVKATIDYIVKMFQNLWGFFFKKDAVAEVDKAKAAIKEAQAEVTEMTSPTSEASADKSLKAVATALSHIDTPEAKTLHTAVVEAKGMDLAGKKAALAKAVPEMPKLNKKVVFDFETAKKDVATLADKFVSWSEKAVTELPKEISGGEGPSGVINRVKKFADNSKSGKKVVETAEIHSLSDAKSFLTKIDALLNEAGDWAKGMRGDEGKIQQMISLMEKISKSKADGVDQKDTAEAKELLPLLRGAMTFASTAAQYMKKSVQGYTRMSKETTRIFGL